MTSTLLTILVVMVTMFPGMVTGMIDVNPQELQYVADHLAQHKCQQLIHALRLKSFQLEEKEDNGQSSLPSTSKPDHQNEPCISKLEKWTQKEGKNKTVEYLALRLAEIGMPKLSSKISSLVLRETSEELHRFFLDDPFKEMIPKKSAVVKDGDVDQETDEEDDVIDDGVDNEDTDDDLFATVVVIATVGLTLMTSVSVCLLCPKAGHFVCQRACPAPCAACYEILVESCQRMQSGAKTGVNKYMLVTPRGAGTGGALAV